MVLFTRPKNCRTTRRRTDCLNKILRDELHKKSLRPIVCPDFWNSIIGITGHVTLDSMGRFLLVHTYENKRVIIKRHILLFLGAFYISTDHFLRETAR